MSPTRKRAKPPANKRAKPARPAARAASAPPTLELSADDARRIAVAAQGLAEPRPARATPAALAAMIERLGVLQIDSVNVLARAHYLPAWSRLGTYEVAALDRMAYAAPRTLFEYWGHMASLLPIDMQPLFRWRMQRAGREAWRHVRAMANYRKALASVLAQIADRGPVGAGDLVVPGKPGKGGWWVWSDAKRAVEWLFYTGRVTTSGRKSFERLYDLTERVIPRDVYAAPTPSDAEAFRALVARSARALGVATELDLRDYYRLPPADARAAIAELVEAGELVPVRVAGWDKLAYLHRGATGAVPRVDPDRVALVSPFDSLVWERARTERLFAMRYRIEIYTPAPKRVHGYYVLPMLVGDQLVGRVDLKADRAARLLRVPGAHLEPAHKRRAADHGDALRTELAGMAAWLGLDGVAPFQWKR
nr:crosslink repair DNA glycosylase YcaQ family protein [Kofleriaceae bacterium]